MHYRVAAAEVMTEIFSVPEKIGFLVVIFTLTFSGCADVLWAWGIGRWAVTPQLAPYFIHQSTLLTGIGVLQLLISVALIGCSYLVCDEEKKGKRRFTFYVSIIVISLVLFACLCPASIYSALAPPEFDNQLALDMEIEVNSNSSWPILKMAYKKFNCCGVFDEENDCPRDIPPFYFNETVMDEYDQQINLTEVPCYQGSTLCSKGCFNLVVTKLVRPYRPVGQILAYIAFGLSIFDPIFLLSIIFGTLCYYKRAHKGFVFGIIGKRNGNYKNRSSSSPPSSPAWQQSDENEPTPLLNTDLAVLRESGSKNVLISSNNSFVTNNSNNSGKNVAAKATLERNSGAL